MPTYRMEKFVPPDLSRDFLWTAAEGVLTVHAPDPITFNLAPVVWDLPDGDALHFRVTDDGSKIAYLVWNGKNAPPYYAGTFVVIDDLKSGVRHLYQFPNFGDPGFYIPDLHLSPGESNLLFTVTRGVGWGWLVVDLKDWSIWPLSLSLGPLGEPDLVPFSGASDHFEDIFATRSSLFISDWTPAGILARKVLVGTDAQPSGIYVANPNTGGVIFAAKYLGWGLYPTQDGERIAFSTTNLHPFDMGQGIPFTAQASLLDMFTREIIELFNVENQQIRITGWSKDERQLFYSLMDSSLWHTEALGIYDLNTGTHRLMVIPEDSEFAPALIGLQALDERRFLVRIQSMESQETSLYTLPIAEFSHEYLTYVQSFTDFPYLLHIPEDWPN